MNNKPYKEKDKSRGMCPLCEKLVTTTFVYHEWSRKDIRKVLMSQCDECHEIIGIPQQSVEEIYDHS